MKLHSFLTCIASLALCDPVAGASSWAFDPGSCSQRYLAVLEPALERATTIAKNTNTWLPNNPALTRSKPQFAKALLGSSYTKYARSVFGGGKIGWRGVNIDIPGIADFTAQMQWTDPSLWGSNLNNLVNTPVGLAERSQHDHRSHNYSHHLLPLTYIKGCILQRRKRRRFWFVHDQPR